MRVIVRAAGRGPDGIRSRSHARRFGLGLLKDTHDLCLKFREFDCQYRAAGMEDQIAPCGQQINMAAQGLAHAALDAVALMGLAQHLAGGQPDARTGGQRRFGKARGWGARNQLIDAD